MIPVIEPSRTERSTSASAARPPKESDSPSTDRMSRPSLSTTGRSRHALPPQVTSRSGHPSDPDRPRSRRDASSARAGSRARRPLPVRAPGLPQSASFFRAPALPAVGGPEPHVQAPRQADPAQPARSAREGRLQHPRRDRPRHRPLRGGDEGGLGPHPAPHPVGRHRPDREAARQEAHDGLGAHARALRQGAHRPLPELGQEPRRRLAGHRDPEHRRARRGGLRPRLHGACRLDGRHQRHQAGQALPPGRRARHPAHRHERLGRRLRARRRRRPRRLRRGLHGAAQDQRRGAHHHVHVRLQRRRRLLPAAPGQLRHPAQRHLLRPHRAGRGEVGAGRGHHPRGAGRPQGARQLGRGRPHRARRAGGAAPGGAAARLHPRQQRR